MALKLSLVIVFAGLMFYFIYCFIGSVKRKEIIPAILDGAIVLIVIANLNYSIGNLFDIL